MKIVAFGTILATAIIMGFSPAHATTQRYDDYDYDYDDRRNPDHYRFCRREAERASDYYGRRPDNYRDGEIIEGAIGGAVLGQIFGGDSESTKKGAALGALAAAIEKGKKDKKESKKRRRYQKYMRSCMRNDYEYADRIDYFYRRR